ncbi:MAG: TauD/TfdA family dioxygenase [Pseudomonadota bacterium]
MPPYLLNDVHAYQAWREQKLNRFPCRENELIIELNNPIKLVDKEISSLKGVCEKANMVIYRCKKASDPRQTILALAQQLGLQQLDANICADEDHLSAIEDTKGKNSNYIPYTSKALNWHTDGYYNATQQRIHSFLMHCVRPAKSGGENTYLDPEIAYILLRDENSDYIRALMQDDVMTIPANEEDDRPVQTGPVFYLDNDEHLCMRYTARKRNINWKKDKQVENAIACLTEILHENSYMFNYRLNAKEGVICNNVLHKRTSYEDDEKQKRLLYRGRFYNRVNCSNIFKNEVNH